MNANIGATEAWANQNHNVTEPTCICYIDLMNTIDLSSNFRSEFANSNEQSYYKVI